MIAILTILTLVISIFSWLLWHQIRINPASLRLGFYVLIIVIFLFISLQVIQFPSISVVHIINEAKLFVKWGNIAGLFLVITLAYHSFQSWRKWQHSLQQLVFPLVLLVYAIADIGIWLLNDGFSISLKPILVVIPWLSLYVLWQFLQFISSSILYGLVVKRPIHGPIVVLGGGLVDGQYVGRIVGNRIQAAVKDATKMSEYPTIIFSGGQGKDELVSEAEAMRDFAVKRLNVPCEKTILEEHSRNTYENLRNSAKLTNSSFTFYTSEYHVFRGVLLAKKQGVNAQGRGGYTQFPYRGIAFLREFAGVMNLNPKQHIIYGTVCFVSSAMVILINFI